MDVPILDVESAVEGTCYIVAAGLLVYAALIPYFWLHMTVPSLATFQFVTSVVYMLSLVNLDVKIHRENAHI